MDRAGHLHAVGLALVCACGPAEPRVAGLQIDILHTDDGSELRVRYEAPELRMFGIKPLVRARCLVGSEVRVDEQEALMGLVEVAPGSHLLAQPGELETALFDGYNRETFVRDKPRLAASPSVCELSITTLLDDKADLLVESCARLGHPPAPGLCPAGTFPAP